MRLPSLALSLLFLALISAFHCVYANTPALPPRGRAKTAVSNQGQINARSHRTPKYLYVSTAEMPSCGALPGATPGGMPIPASPSLASHASGGSVGGPDTVPFHQWYYDYEESGCKPFAVPTEAFEKCFDKLYAVAHSGRTLGKKGEGAMVTIGFYLRRDGSVTGARILKSSTNQKFRAQALNLVRKVRLPGWQKGPALVVCELTVYGGDENPTMDPEPDNGAIP